MLAELCAIVGVPLGCVERDRGEIGGFGRGVGVTTSVTSDLWQQAGGRHFLDAMAVVSDALYALDAEWTVVAFNAAAEAYFGFAAERVLGRNFWDIFPQGRGTEFGDALERAMRERKGACLNTESSLTPGRTIIVTIGVWGEGICVAIKDVTEHERIRAKLSESLEETRLSEERFRLVAESAPVMLWMGDAKGKCLYLNRAQREFWGVALEDVSTFDWGTTIHPDDAEALYEPFQRGMQTQSGFTVEARYKRADGEWRVLNSHAHPRFDGRGEFAGMIGVNVDVTDARAAEKALHALNATLEQRVEAAVSEQKRAAAALEQAREELFHAQKMEAVGQLTAGIAHDFNNMLAGVIGAMNLLERRLQAKRYDETGKYIAAALESANRAASLTSRLLAFGRRQSLDIKAIDANQSILAIEPLVARTLGENVALTMDLDETAGLALTDAHQLESAILNLALNARDAMPHGGVLTLSTRCVRCERTAGRDLKPGDYLEVSVRDTGVGMDPEVASRAFEPFFTTKPSGAGTGLGLSMVYGFAKQTGGDVTIESKVGEGTIIRFFLPIAAASEADRDAEASYSTVEGRGEVVLVVEDDALVRMLVMDVLKELGYEAKEAKDAPTAIPLIESGARVDLLISDVGLPGLNGRQLADIARHHHPGLRVLFLTGYAEQAAVRSGFLGAGMDLMTKPFAVDALALKIREMLQH